MSPELLLEIPIENRSLPYCPAFKRLPGWHPGKSRPVWFVHGDPLHLPPSMLPPQSKPFTATLADGRPFLQSVSVSESGFCAQLLSPPFHSITNIRNSPEPVLDLKNFPSRAVALRIDVTSARTDPHGFYISFQRKMRGSHQRGPVRKLNYVQN